MKGKIKSWYEILVFLVYLSEKKVTVVRLCNRRFMHSCWNFGKEVENKIRLKTTEKVFNWFASKSEIFCFRLSILPLFLSIINVPFNFVQKDEAQNFSSLLGFLWRWYDQLECFYCYLLRNIFRIKDIKSFSLLFLDC